MDSHPEKGALAVDQERHWEKTGVERAPGVSLDKRADIREAAQGSGFWRKETCIHIERAQGEAEKESGLQGEGSGEVSLGI